MNQIEERLQAAGDETRRLARSRRPPVLDPGPARTRGWLVLAAAFATVALTFGLIPWLASQTQTTTDGDLASTPVPSTTLSTLAETTASDPAETCSSSETPVPGEVAGLPPAVAETRNAIIAAVADCDIASLEAIAGDQFATSFGSGGVESLRQWEDRGQGELGTLLQLLDMGHGTIALDGGGEIYVWPAAHARESWEAVTGDDVEDLARIYDPGELDQFASANSYLGWRTGIDDQGRWLYFIAGD